MLAKVKVKCTLNKFNALSKSNDLEFASRSPNVDLTIRVVDPEANRKFVEGKEYDLYLLNAGENIEGVTVNTVVHQGIPPRE